MTLPPVVSDPEACFANLAEGSPLPHDWEWQPEKRWVPSDPPGTRQPIEVCGFCGGRKR